MVLDDSLVAAGDEDEMLDAGLARLVDHMLNQRPVDHRQQLLRHGLGGRQEPGAQPGDRENGFADRFHEPVGIVVVTLVASICLGIAEVSGCNGRWNAGGKAIKSYAAGRRQGVPLNVRQPSEFPITHTQQSSRDEAPWQDLPHRRASSARRLWPPPPGQPRRRARGWTFARYSMRRARTPRARPRRRRASRTGAANPAPPITR